ncbi:MAG: YihY/virulence factor BrkB family protein [Treponema sp.]|nr:YihY/virulence factor BrkB family protein [Treponema sp.]
MFNFIRKFEIKLKNLYIKTGQIIYLACLNFYENNILESINSCAFGFIFSFIPIILIILAVLSGILQAYPSLQNYVMNFVNDLKPVIDISSVLNQVMTMKSVGWVEIILGIWVVWMARKLFSSILQAINKIFHSVTQRTTLFNQIFVFFLELVLVFAILLVVILIFVFNKLSSLPFMKDLEQFLPITLLTKISSNISLITNIILFVSSTILFRLASGVKPKYHLCAFFAALATGSFNIVSFFLRLFIDASNYNLVYGAISSIILLMMQVWFFFMIFLFFAQVMFCTIYRELLGLGCLYMMPHNPGEDDSTWSHYKRNLFRLNPTKVTKYETKLYNPGDKIFEEGDNPDCVYYIRSGSVHRISKNSESYLNQGAFFGEMHCMLNIPRTSTATACTPCIITQIKSSEFLSMLHTYPKASSKAISKISTYTAKLYEMNGSVIFESQDSEE